jgi:mRNA interferase RelE/StbE
MAKYSVEITASAERTLLKLPKTVVGKIVKRLQNLSYDPFPPDCRKLTGENHVYRIRVGTYRIIYELYKKEVLILVLKVGHRKDIYRR